jgi:hypothetical protein
MRRRSVNVNAKEKKGHVTRRNAMCEQQGNASCFSCKLNEVVRLGGGMILPGSDF